MLPEIRALEDELRALRRHPRLRGVITSGGRTNLSSLELEDIAALLTDPAAALLLLAAADLNRTAVRAALNQPDVQLVPRPLRRAFVVRSQLPRAADFSTLVELALQRRTATLGRSANAATEALFRDRLAFEGIPIRMHGAYTSGLLIDRRKPDGVYPDPDTGAAPTLYFEIKKINRVRDDIQKRLYEIAEVSLEVKFIYGQLELRGLDLGHLLEPGERVGARAAMRKQILQASPAVVALLICRPEELEVARRYRPGIETFIDRLFLSDEIDDCIGFLADITSPA
jgi:hypothetical protein